MSKSGYGTCAVVVGALGFFATIALTAETKAEDAAPANPPSGTAAPAAQQAPPAPGLLTWQIRDVTDKLTDAKTRKAVSGGAFDDGIALEASAMCDKVGVEFAFDTFRDHKPAQFAWQEGLIALRVRIDGGAVRTARAKGEYGNEVKIAFYDPVVAEHLIRGATPRADRDDPILGPFKNVMGNAMLNAIQSDAAGKLNELSGARSIRVELPLANGNAYVVELNPQDQALGGLVRQCIADLQASIPPAPKPEAPQKVFLKPPRFGIPACLTSYMVFDDTGKVIGRAYANVTALTAHFSETKGDLGLVEISMGENRGARGWVDIKDYEMRMRLPTCR
jgi:hypothetical protein